MWPSLMVKKVMMYFGNKRSLSITTKMLALEDGKFGAQIKLKNPESQEIVSGIVSGPGKQRDLKKKIFSIEFFYLPIY